MDKELKETKDKKELLKILWDLRHLTLKECLEKISTDPDLKFLLTATSIWLLVKWILGLWIAVHVIYFVTRVFNLVLA
jgi:hypothetical protein